MADDLHLLGPGKIRNLAGECGRIERFAREKIEIERLPMTKPQRQRRPAIKREMFGCRVELRPQRPLWQRQNVEPWPERSRDGPFVSGHPAE